MEGAFGRLLRSLRAEGGARRLGAESDPGNSRRVDSALAQRTRAPVASVAPPSPAAKVAVTFPEKRPAPVARATSLAVGRSDAPAGTAKPALSSVVGRAADPREYRIRVGD